MNIQDCYRLLGTSTNASDEEITHAYKKLALLYHPDRNRDRVEWATRAMANLNIAYTTITSQRFKDTPRFYTARPPRKEPPKNFRTEEEARNRQRPAKTEAREVMTGEMLTHNFVRARETAKDAIYKYFQYGLYNMFRRENPINQGIFHEVVLGLRKCYHEIKKLSSLTGDRDFLEHFDIFKEMVFNFYRASECLNIPDSYSSMVDIEAFRLYKKGDNALHLCQKELFFDRHNRGSYRKDIAVPNLLDAEYYFRKALERFPDSTWAVETGIKLEYVLSLKKYLALFF